MMLTSPKFVLKNKEFMVSSIGLKNQIEKNKLNNSIDVSSPIK